MKLNFITEDDAKLISFLGYAMLASSFHGVLSATFSKIPILKEQIVLYPALPEFFGGIAMIWLGRSNNIEFVEKLGKGALTVGAVGIGSGMASWVTNRVVKSFSGVPAALPENY